MTVYKWLKTKNSHGNLVSNNEVTKDNKLTD